MAAFSVRPFLPLALTAIIAGCASSPAPVAPPPTALPATNAYVAPQSAPVLPPSYPALAGPVMQAGTASIPLTQGNIPLIQGR